MIKLAHPDIRRTDIQKAVDVFKSGNLVQGRYVSDFENELCGYTGIKHAVVTSSCTAALHLSLLAMNIGAGDSVIVPAFTFPATANAVEITGASVILSDVDPDTYTITPENLEKTISKNKRQNIKAIIIVHEFGYPADIKSMAGIAAKYHLSLIEDAACALGTIAGGKHVGHFSDAACFSFHPRKAITTGEGGAVLTRNTGIAEKIRQLRNHGICYNELGMDFRIPGLNYRMTDFQASLAIGQIKRFDRELIRRKKLAAKYYNLLLTQKSIRLPSDHDGHSWQSFMIMLKKPLNRKKIIDALFKKGIQSNLGAQALHCLTYYKNKYRFHEEDFKVAAELFRRGLVIPLYGRINGSQAEYISRTLSNIINKSNL